MIENSARGITLAKPLARTILVSVIGTVWYGGSTVASLSHATQSVVQSMATYQAAMSQVEVRVRALENNASRQDARFDGLKQSLDEVKQAQRETNTLLRELAQEALSTDPSPLKLAYPSRAMTLTPAQNTVITAQCINSYHQGD